MPTTPSESRDLRINAAAGTVSVYRSSSWTYVQASLASAAPGNNQLGFQSGLMPYVSAGDELNLIMPPDTDLLVRTDAQIDAQWSFWITPLAFIDDIVNLLYYIAFGEQAGCPPGDRARAPGLARR